MSPGLASVPPLPSVPWRADGAATRGDHRGIPVTAATQEINPRVEFKIPTVYFSVYLGLVLRKIDERGNIAKVNVEIPNTVKVV